MRDKNGKEIKQGMSVIDVHGNKGVMCNVSGAEAIKFNHDGEERYVFPHRIVESHICIVEDNDEIKA